MVLPLPIGRNAAGELFYIDILQISHLFVSCFNHRQSDALYSSLLKVCESSGFDNNPMFAIAATTNTSLFTRFRENCFLSYIRDDVFSSTASSREEFLVSLSKELKRRQKVQLVKQSSRDLKTVLNPLIIIMDDVLEIIISNKKTIGLSFLQLLFLGSAVNMHVIAASTYTCRHLLRQLMNTNTLVRSKFKSFFNQGILLTPSIAELVFTSEDFVFFKGYNDFDYYRLYPLKTCSVS